MGKILSVVMITFAACNDGRILIGPPIARRAESTFVDFEAEARRLAVNAGGDSKVATNKVMQQIDTNKMLAALKEEGKCTEPGETYQRANLTKAVKAAIQDSSFNTKQIGDQEYSAIAKLYTM